MLLRKDMKPISFSPSLEGVVKILELEIEIES